MISNLIIITPIFFFLYYFFFKLSFYVNLLDYPTERKKHVGKTPLIGGLIIFFTLFLLNFYIPIEIYNNFLLYSFLILLIGLLDDVFNLNPYSRFLFQILICTVFISNNIQIQISTLGDYLFLGEIELNYLSIIFTIFCIVATINSINFIDGVDGYASFKSLLILILILILNDYSDNKNIFSYNFLIPIIFIILIFFLINSRIIKLPQIFLGDAGSNLLGFFIAISLIHTYHSTNLHPIIFAWIVSIPIFELLSLFIIRIKNNKNPFKPDSNHLHFILLNRYQSKFIIFFVITLMFIVVNLIGYLSLTYINSLTSLVFLILFFIFYLIMIYKNFK